MKKKNKLEVQAFNMWPKQADSSIPFLKPKENISFFDFQILNSSLCCLWETYILMAKSGI